LIDTTFFAFASEQDHRAADAVQREVGDGQRGLAGDGGVERVAARSNAARRFRSLPASST
jgi:hypothetical protein